jgi:hypothetical protein
VREHDLVFRVVHRVDQLFARKPYVNGMEDGPDHRDREVAFQVAVGIPVHHRDRVANIYAHLDYASKLSSAQAMLEGLGYGNASA